MELNCSSIFPDGFILNVLSSTLLVFVYFVLPLNYLLYKMNAEYLRVSPIPWVALGSFDDFVYLLCCVQHKDNKLLKEPVDLS